MTKIGSKVHRTNFCFFYFPLLESGHKSHDKSPKIHIVLQSELFLTLLFPIKISVKTLAAGVTLMVTEKDPLAEWSSVPVAGVP
jgi:hypothetical protein